MTGRLAQRWVLVGAGILTIGLGAAAGIAEILDWEGRWATWLLIAALVAASAGAVVDRFVVPHLDREEQRVADEAVAARHRVEDEWRARDEAERDQARAARLSDEESRARAVELMLIAQVDGVALVVTNQSRHEVTGVRVECWAAGDGPDAARRSPTFVPSTVLGPDLGYQPIAGGGHEITLAALPAYFGDGGATGTVVGSLVPPSDEASRVDFTVDWHDHERRARRLWGLADLRTVVAPQHVSLNPPPSLTEPAEGGSA